MSRTEFTDEQRAAIEAIHGGVALSAAAGSGKTTVLVERYLRMLASGVNPSQILTVTFTVEAAEQLKQRILDRLREHEISTETRAEVEKSRFIGTLHSFCFLVLDGYGSFLELPPIQSILDPFEFHAEFDRFFREWQESLTDEDFSTWAATLSPTETQEFVRTLYEIRHELPNDASGPLATLISIARPLLERVEAHFFHRGIYSFNDLESLTLKLLTRFPAVADRWRNQFKHICVDEFQDTSQMQWRILQPLLGGNYGKLFLVGDPKQSIYRFRQADVGLFYLASETIVSQGGEALQLTANFRSAPAVLAEVNRIATGLFAGSRFGDVPMRSGKSGGPPGGYRIERYLSQKTDLVECERQAVAGYVEKLLHASEPSQVALLFRVSDRIAAYAEALRARGIPVRAKKTQPLFDSPAVGDVGNYLRAVANPLHDYALASFLRSPYVGWSYQRLYDLHRLPGDSLFEKLQSQPSELGWFFQVIEDGSYGVEESLTALFRATGRWPEDPDAFRELLGPLLEADDLDAALAKWTLWEGADLAYTVREGDEGAVSLLTVHAAKGLEFPTVLLVDNLRLASRRAPVLRAEPGHAPALKFRIAGEPVESEAYRELAQLQHARDEEESRRVLYVALTRAQQNLTVFLPQDRALIPARSWGNLLDKN